MHKEYMQYTVAERIQTSRLCENNILQKHMGDNYCVLIHDYEYKHFPTFVVIHNFTMPHWSSSK